MKKRVFLKKTFIIMTLIAFAIAMYSGCSVENIEYDSNLGYDLNNVGGDDITFNVYHTDPVEGSWELIKSFPCDPQTGHFNDVKVEGGKNKIRVVLEDNTYTESDDGESAKYDGEVISSFDYSIDGFNGDLLGWKNFDIKDKKEEQLVRLYPISNESDVPFLEDVDLDRPYDTDGETIDNILITIEMK